MILSFSVSDIIRVPFGYLLEWLYNLTANYGIALILFAVVVKLILLPAGIKSKRSMMKISRMAPLVKKLEKKYGDDKQKYNEAVTRLYKENNVSMTGGCLWSFLPLLLLIPLYYVIRQPIQYVMHVPHDEAVRLVEVIKTAAPELFGSNSYYDQLTAAIHLPEYLDQVREAIPALANFSFPTLNFNFLQVNLGLVPDFAFWKWAKYDWPTIGLFLLPLLSAGSQVLTMLISQKMNNTVITNERGERDEKTAKANAQSNVMMMVMMPIMSLWIGFTVPAALSLYWLIQGILGIVQDVILTRVFRKDYDAEDLARQERAALEAAEEAERERIRAKRRAENPDGITENTSKKKLQQRQREEDAAAAREYAARKAGVEPNAGPLPLSGIPGRPFARGRAYQEDHYPRQKPAAEDDGEDTEE